MEKIDKHFSDDIQNTVAKLLAKEDVTVQRSYQYKTAFFDIKKRLMGLPVFKESFPREVYDLFIGHEVGHALWTTIEEAERFNDIFHKPDLYNILEDIRIERRVQNEYPGLQSMFRKGYRALWSRKFFGVQTMEEVNRLNFLDRLNIFAKISAPVLFSDEEQPIVDEAMKVRNIDEIIEVAHKIINLTKNAAKQPSQNPAPQPKPSQTEEDEDEYAGSPSSSEFESNENETEGQGDQKSEDGDSKENENSGSETEPNDGTESEGKGTEESTQDTDDATENIDSDDFANETTSNGNGPQDDFQPEGDVDPLESLTQKSFGESFNDSIDDTPKYDQTVEFVEPSREEIYRRVIGFKEVMADRQDYYFDPTLVHNVREYEQYQKFVKDSKQTVSHLTNQFQQKKAAYQYSRATRSTRGVVDMNSLYKYKYDDNIFMSNTILADAKSHGLVMMIDLSGSMAGSRIFGVIKQTLIMTTFCQKNKIPFGVYTWTDLHGNKFKAQDDLTAFDDKLSLAGTTVHCVLSSDMKKQTYKTAAWQLYRIGAMGGYSDWANIPGGYKTNYDSMGMTPICHTLLISSKLLVDLKKTWNVQVMNFMFLTDGEGYELTKNSTRKMFNGDLYNNDRETLYRNKHVGKINGHRVSLVYGKHYENLINHISNDLKVNTIGLFETHRIGNYENKICMNVMANKPGLVYTKKHEDVKNIKSEFRKNGISFREDCGGYKKFIMINSSVSDFEMSSNYDEGDIKSIQKDFIKVGTNKKAKRVFAAEIIDTICSKL